MNKSEFIEAVAESTGVPKTQTGKVIDAALKTISDALVGGEKVILTGFGTFEVRTRVARTGVNPKTREPLKIPETKVPSFKAGKVLKEAVK